MQIDEKNLTQVEDFLLQIMRRLSAAFLQRGFEVKDLEPYLDKLKSIEDEFVSKHSIPAEILYSYYIGRTRKVCKEFREHLNPTKHPSLGVMN